MKVSDLGEFGLIEKLSKFLPINDKDIIVGFGDDTACVNVNGKLILLTGDIQVENRHFIKSKINPIDLGWKLISSNVSDVVACGGIPRWGLISLGLPKNLEYEFIQNVYKGFKEALDFYNFVIIGGNTSSSSEIILDFFLTGETQKFISRSDAKSEQYVFISGELGMSKAGLELLLMDKNKYEPFEERLIKFHTRPIARIDIQEKIQNYAESCIDISDGLAGDLHHISEKSNVKIVIQKDKLPINEDLKKYCEKYNKNIYDYILYGGEDYQLAFTVKEKNKHHFKDFYEIGLTKEGKGIFLIEKGNMIKINPKGFEHL